jgi:hypothetical protein
LVTVSAVFAVPAIIASWVFDIANWTRARSNFAILNWPRWHAWLVVLAAIAPPILFFAAHYGQKWGTHGLGQFGPPKAFWVLAPATMLAVHILCLIVRSLQGADSTTGTRP